MRRSFAGRGREKERASLLRRIPPALRSVGCRREGKRGILGRERSQSPFEAAEQASYGVGIRPEVGQV